ncbi:sensor histidine kinase [Neobacillus sp.]|uniref:sensor histidine kinase n=1 Tax=Neobacillus sp. TaxID=2675273 RepID=UPI00289C7594|nr:sensor histidine kinase [Neobacillus sp.]
MAKPFYRIKLMVWISCIILIIGGSIGWTIYTLFSYQQKKEIHSTSKLLVDRSIYQFNDYLTSLEMLSLRPLETPSILKFLKEQSTSLVYPSATERNEIWSFLGSMKWSQLSLNNVHLYTIRGLHLTSTDSFPTTENRKDWMVDSDLKKGSVTFLPLHKEGDKKMVFSLIRQLRDPATLKPLGYVVLEIDPKRCSNLFPFFNEKDSMVITDEDDQTILLTNEKSLNSLSFQKKDPTTNFFYNVYVSLESYDKTGSLMKRGIALFTMALLFIGLLFAWFITHHLSRHVVLLQKSMKEMEKGHFQQKIPIHTSDELGSLARGMENMGQTIQNLIEEGYEKSLREKESELRALQTQIQPHFLYNTLELINMMAITKGQYGISDIVSSLGTLFRHALQGDTPLIYWKNEKSMAESYLMIQKARLGDSLSYEIREQGNIEKAYVPKFILQPLLENSLRHGMGSHSIFVTISIKEEKDTYTVKVIDNGKGMNPSKLEELNARLERESYSTKSISLLNIKRRLHLLYGEKAIFNIESLPGSYTVITMTIPKEGKK